MVEFRMKLDEALTQGKGWLSQKGYEKYLAEGQKVGWDADRIEKYIDGYKHLRTWCGSIRMKMAGFLSNTQAGLEDAKSEKKGEITRESQEQNQPSELSSKVQEEEERHNKAAKKRQKAELETETAAQRVREVKERQRERESQKDKPKRQLGEVKRPSYVRPTMFIGAITGGVIAWILAVNEGGRPDELIIAAVGGAVLGSLVLPITIFLLRVAMRIFVVALLIFIVILGVLFLAMVWKVQLI